jgi:haloalkane dehalogenase
MSANELPFQVPHELFPVEHRFTDVDGAQVHYVDEGVGETILLLHGNPAWSFLYRKIIVGLKPQFRCVALDYPGYGMSSAPAPATACRAHRPGTGSRRASTALCWKGSWTGSASAT